MSVEKLRDVLVGKAKAEAEAIIRNAEEEAKRILEEAKREFEAEVRREVERLRRELGRDRVIAEAKQKLSIVKAEAFSELARRLYDEVRRECERRLSDESTRREFYKRVLANIIPFIVGKRVSIHTRSEDVELVRELAKEYNIIGDVIGCKMDYGVKAVTEDGVVVEDTLGRRIDYVLRNTIIEFKSRVMEVIEGEKRS